MAYTSTYLNFDGTTEAAFTFYKTVFGTEFVAGIMRMGDVPPEAGQPSMSDEQKQLVVNVTLPITGGHLLMGGDVPESMRLHFVQGSNVDIAISLDTPTEADRLFAALSEGGQVEMAMSPMFWGDYFGSLIDQYGIHWMVSTSATE